MAKFLAQIIVAGTQILGRAFARALKQEIEASQDAARRLGNTRTRAERAANTKAGLSLDEAKLILNVKSSTDAPLDRAEIEKQYEALFKANEKSNGGTLYIQSKIVRAKERFDMELKGTDDGAGEQQQERKAEAGGKT